MTFNPAPKPGPKRKGRAVRRSPKMRQAVRNRDGTCLYGLIKKDGCAGPLDVHHITSFGSDPTGDVLENMIVLCRKHHEQAESNRFHKIVLMGLLYHFYGYGLPNRLQDILDKVKEMAQYYGFRVIFDIQPSLINMKFVGFSSSVDLSIDVREMYKEFSPVDYVEAKLALHARRRNA